MVRVNGFDVGADFLGPGCDRGSRAGARGGAGGAFAPGLVCKFPCLVRCVSVRICAEEDG